MWGKQMSVAKVTEISASSTKSFEAALQASVARAAKPGQRAECLDSGP